MNVVQVISIPTYIFDLPLTLSGIKEAIASLSLNDTASAMIMGLGIKAQMAGLPLILIIVDEMEDGLMAGNSMLAWELLEASFQVAVLKPVS